MTGVSDLEIFGTGPRGYANDGIEEKFVADVSLPRACVVRTLGEQMQAYFGRPPPGDTSEVRPPPRRCAYDVDRPGFRMETLGAWPR